MIKEKGADVFQFLATDFAWIKTKSNKYTGFQPMIRLTIFLFFQLSNVIYSSPVLCPPYYVYLESGNDCVSMKKNCGNILFAKHQCMKLGATLVSMIFSTTHFNELCEFAKKQLPDNFSFYLDAHRDGDKFVWELTNKEVSFLQTLTFDDRKACLEMVVSEMGCYLNDAPCDKKTFPVCEFAHVNPCVYDNGGCEGQCVPRHRDRKCICAEGLLAKGTKCTDVKVEEEVVMTCPSPSTNERNENLCLFGHHNKYSLEANRKDCRIKFGLELLTSILDNETELNRYCRAINISVVPYIPNTSHRYYVGGFYNVREKYMLWSTRKYVYDPVLEKFVTGEQEGKIWYNPKLCGTGYKVTSGHEFYTTVLKITSEGCCVEPKYSSTDELPAICDVPQPNKCKIAPDYGNCTKLHRCVPKSGFWKYECQPMCPSGHFYFDGTCEDVDECYVKNGGCVHTCRNTVGSRECLCLEGYELVNDTECQYTDRCMGDVEATGCPGPVKIIFGTSGCEMLQSTNTSASDAPSNISAVNGLINSTVVVVLLFFGLFLFLC